METSQRVQINILIFILVATLVVEWIQKIIASRVSYDPMIILGAARLLQVVLIFLIVVIWGKGVGSIGLDLQRIFFGIKKGLIWSFGFGILAFFGYLVLFLVGIDPLPMIKMSMNSNINQFIIFICIGGILGPVAEEIFLGGSCMDFLGDGV